LADPCLICLESHFAASNTIYLQQLCIILHSEELTQKTVQQVKPEDSDSDFEEDRWRKQLKLHSDCRVEVPSNRSVLFFINSSRVLYDVCAFSMQQSHSC